MEAKFFSVITDGGTQAFVNPNHIVKVVQSNNYCRIHLVTGDEFNVNGLASEVLKLAKAAV